MNQTFRKFNIHKKYLDSLSISERKIVKILEGVVEKTGEIYEKQLHDGFYPKGITKKDVENAGKNDAEILSPFTLVVNRDGKLIAIPYHKKYAKDLEIIAQEIEKAVKLSDNPSFKKYLLVRAKSLRDGSYRDADIAWLNVKNSKIDFSIGPFERYLDKTLFIKRTFQAHVGIINQEYSRLAEQYKEALYSSAKISGSKYHSTGIPKKGVSISVQAIPTISGYAADVLFSGEHFPSDTDIALNYGSKIVIYLSQLTLKFEKLYYPIFKIIFEKRFAAKYSKNALLKATGWTVLLYELAKQLHKFERSRERLQELYGPIDEANGFASGIAHSKHLVVKGLISQEQLEAIIIIHILWIFADWLYYLHNQHKESHVIGNSILLNSYLKNGALKESGGISWPNFSKIFFLIESLANELVNLQQKGNYKDAEVYIKKNASFDNIEKLGRNLKNLTVKL